MLKARLEKIGNKYSKHMYIYDTMKEGTDRDMHVETPVLAETIITDGNMDATFIVDTNKPDAYIVRDDGYEIYSGYTSKEILRQFKLL